MKFGGAVADVDTATTRRRRAEALCRVLTFLLVLGAGAWEVAYGEIYAPHGLAAGDSRFYAWMARDLPHLLHDQRLDAIATEQGVLRA